MFERNNGSTLDTRLVSAFPISLPTSFAFESIFPGRQPTYDLSRVIPVQVDIGNYQEMWINIYTLFRNLSGVMDKATFLVTSDEMIANAIFQEMEVIDSLLLNEGQGLCTAVYYACTYVDLYLGKVNKFVRARKDNTDYQKSMTIKYNNCLSYLDKLCQYKKFNTNIKGSGKNALMLSHVPYDLLSYEDFNKLDLIESHTGVLKSRHLWYTKFYNLGEEDLRIIPYMKKTLLIFGDKVLIQPMDIRLRRQILQIAKDRQWTQVTTVSKIMFDINAEIKEPLVLDVIRSL